MTRSCVAHNIFGFQIQMDNRLSVHVFDTFAYLSNEQNAIVFGQCEVIGNDSFKQLATGDTGKFENIKSAQVIEV